MEVLKRLVLNFQFSIFNCEAFGFYLLFSSELAKVHLIM
jgi:hypothetical protein